MHLLSSEELSRFNLDKENTHANAHCLHCGWMFWELPCCHMHLHWTDAGVATEQMDQVCAIYRQ